MSFGRKIMSVFTLAIAIIGFNTFATAQDTTDQDKESVERSERKGRFAKEGKRGKRGKRGRRGMRRDRGLQRMLSKLDLTDSQKSQIETIRGTQRTGNQPTREEAKSLMMKRRDGSITEAEKTRLGDIKNEMRNSAEQTKNTILALLTPEQTQKLEQMKAERKQRMEERRQMREQRRQDREQSTKTEGN